MVGVKMLRNESMPLIGEYRFKRVMAAAASTRSFSAVDFLTSSQLVVAPEQWPVAPGSVAKLKTIDVFMFPTAC
uniref:Uncharacterized protein n=1 Tax=Glossina palpalis gambiensis TaxID=67801 RepID=A0A1B0C625_9MUSC